MAGNDFLILIFQLVVLLFSAIIHEVSHGLVAYQLGDDTAKQMGRLTLNPKKHLDPFGSVLMPLFLFLVSHGSFIVGWAKPVPYNPYNLKNPKLGAALIGIAGPISNLTIAVIFGILVRIIAQFSMSPVLIFLNIIVFVNILLAIFNLVPIPPLDGSKILFSLMPKAWHRLENFLERHGLFLLILFIFFGFNLIFPIINFFYHSIVGSFAIF